MSTNVQPKNKNNNAPACSQIIPTNEGNIEIPPKAHEFGVSLKQLQEGEKMEITVGDAVITKNGEMKLANGTTLKVEPKQVKALADSRKARMQMNEKLNKQTENAR